MSDRYDMMATLVTRLSAATDAAAQWRDSFSSSGNAPAMQAAAATFLEGLLALLPEVERAVLFAPDGDSRLSSVGSRARQPGSFLILKHLVRAAYRDATRQAAPPPTGVGAVVVVPFWTAAGQGPFILHAEVSDLGRGDAAAARLEAAARFGAATLEVAAAGLRAAGSVTAIAQVLTAVVDAKDTYTGGHSQRVADYSVAVATAFGLDEAKLAALRLSALLHDIGKIGINDAILRKPGLLSNAEFDEMKEHPLLGERIIQSAPEAAAILDGIKYHHERFDGTGYPSGLEGEAIPLFGRIVAIADAFDAMTSGRSYSGFMGTEEAIVALAAKTDLFDPGLLQSMVKSYESGSLTRGTGTRLGRTQ